MNTNPLLAWRNRLTSLPDWLSFSKFPIHKRTVFYATDLSFAFTNLKPVVPGHVLVSPFRVVDRMTKLTQHEVEDLFRCARLVGDAVLRAHPHADSLTFTVQDGPSAGQTVPHVHVHVMPRWSNDPFNSSRAGNDSVYEAVDEAEKSFSSGGVKVDSANDSTGRTRDDMISEGLNLREHIEDVLSEIRAEHG